MVKNYAKGSRMQSQQRRGHRQSPPESSSGPIEVCQFFISTCSQSSFKLVSIHTARLRIEEIAAKAPETIESEQMKALVQSVKKNISDILGLLDNIDRQLLVIQEQESQGKAVNGSGKSKLGPATVASSAIGTAPVMVKKLRNDVTKEEVFSLLFFHAQHH